MRPAISAILALLLGASAAVAQTCPPAPDHSEALDALIEEARAAETEARGQALSNKMWELWADAPDEPAQAILDRGMARRSGWDLAGALADFNRLIAYCPDYAEGYNQRAFVNFLRQDYAAAVVDLERTLDLSPRHVAAISGLALTLMALGRTDEARETLARALALNPWIPERGLAAPGGPLAPVGREL